jgi:hypothetical protein
VTPAPKVDLDAAIVREVAGPVTYVFRASRLMNGIYALDCAAGLMHCSSEGFARSLELDDGDRDALARWKELHLRYSGTFVSREESSDPPPLPIITPVPRGLLPHIRVAVTDAPDALERLSIFLEPGDVAEAERVMRRFDARLERLWLARRAELAAKVDDFATLMARPDVVEIVGRVERFYAPEQPPHTREIIDLIARPKEQGSDYGEQLGDHAFVETRPEEKANERLDVVFHELCHRWFASAPWAKKRALVNAFVSSDAPFARIGYGLLDETLATAFGNGLVARAVDRADFESRLAKPRGLYNDPFIDAAAKATLPWLDAYTASNKTIYDAEFPSAYIERIASTFPNGAVPIAHMRPLASVYAKGLEEEDDHLRRVARPGWAESRGGFEKEGRGLLAEHPIWATAVLVLEAHIADVEGVERHVDAKQIARLRAEAKKGTPFVLTITRDHAEPLFVFVAADAAQMHALIDRFAALNVSTGEIWR